MLNKKELNKKDLKITLMFTLLSGLGGLLIALYQSQNMTTLQLGAMSKEMFIAISTIQVAILYGFILSFIGLKLSRATNLNKGLLESLYTNVKYKINSKSAMIAIGFGCINAAAIVLSEKFIFARYIPEIANSTPQFSILYLLGGIVYGGIVEEIMLRLFLMSLITFILYKIFANKKDKNNIPQYIYWISIIISAILFGVGHLPAASMMFILTPIVLFRIIFLNAFAGILFGYLYWKNGFEYGVIAHMFSHIFMQLVFLPILF